MNAIVRKEAPTSEPATVLALIERAAKDPATDIDKMQKLLEMHQGMMTRKAEQDFAAAMVHAQGQMRRIEADATNPQTRSKYASYAALDRALRPIYSDGGFALSFDTGQSPLPEHVRVLCYVSHANGHTRTYHVDMPCDGKGAKGGDVMTKTHAMGAALSYGSRYLLKLIWNVAVGEDDDDGNGAGPQAPHITDEQLATLEDMIASTGSDRAKFLRWLKVESLSNLPAKAYEEAYSALKQKEKAKP